jgi:Protein of unknown function (DUF2510)
MDTCVSLRSRGVVAEPINSPMADPGVQPGWYPDPQIPDTKRYWDGQDWTEDVSVGGPPPGSTRRGGPGIDVGGVLIVGGYVAAFLAPAIGLAIGLVLVFKGRRDHGSWICLLSVAMLVIGFIVAAPFLLLY